VWPDRWRSDAPEQMKPGKRANMGPFVDEMHSARGRAQLSVAVANTIAFEDGINQVQVFTIGTLMFV